MYNIAMIRDLNFTREEVHYIAAITGVTFSILPSRMIGLETAHVAPDGPQAAVEVNYSKTVVCSSIGFTAPDSVVEAVATADIEGSSERVTQVMINWGVPDERATTGRHGSEDLFEPQRYDYSMFGKGVYEITASMLTVDKYDVTRYVPSGDNCTVSLTIN